MKRDQVGRLIGASFGLVFVLVNADALPVAIAVPVRLLAVVAFLGVVLRRRGGGAPLPVEQATPGASFGRRYWYVVAAEVLAVLAGLIVINRILHAPRASVGWIALVVGLHFFGLAAVWRRPALHRLATAMTLCAAAGLVLAAYGAPAAVIATASGIAPGALLLASVWRSGRQAVSAVPDRAPVFSDQAGVPAPRH
ncbi:hypothetical protein ACFWBF_29465 [Streptomyces sp. NPDC060028]|uniref:hypothetical protein n=1 Tax=Streptomyces sp. NPDC060028 TaxID=3347041 RepID=UPI0036C02845